MKTEKEVLEIVKDLNSRFLGKYYEGELIVAVDIHRGVDGFSICNFNEILNHSCLIKLMNHSRLTSY